MFKEMKYSFFIAFIAGVLSAGCLKTEGILEIKGKVLDEGTKELIPGRGIIIQGLVRTDSVFVPVFAGQTSTDSSGVFKYSLHKVKGAWYYNFYLVGDSDYSFRTVKLGLMELDQNALFLSFMINRLVDLSIEICRKTKTPVCDTLSVYWDSDGVEGRKMYPYKVNNIGIRPAIGLCWIGGNVMSVIETRVFADKLTKVHWELIRNGKRSEITDTITCRRDLKNRVYFGY